MVNKWPLLLSLSILGACDKGEIAEYYVSCTKCQVSYWAEGKTFIPRAEVRGEFRYRFERKNDDRLLLVAQNDTIPDVLQVSIFVDGNKVAEDVTHANVLYLTASAKADQ